MVPDTPYLSNPPCQVADRHPNNWNCIGGDVLNIVETQRQKDWCQSFGAAQFAVSAIASYDLWCTNQMERLFYLEVRERAVLLPSVLLSFIVDGADEKTGFVLRRLTQQHRGV